MSSRPRGFHTAVSMVNMGLPMKITVMSFVAIAVLPVYGLLMWAWVVA